MTPRRMSNPLEKPTYIVYVYYGVGNYPAEGAPGLVARRDNGRGPYFGRNFSSPQGGRDAHTREPRSGPGEGKKVRMRCTKVPPFYVRGFRTRSVVRGRGNFLLPSRLLSDD